MKNIKIIYLLAYLIIFFSFTLLLTFAIKGDNGFPLRYQFSHDTVVTGPFEGSNSTSRYALTEAIVERGTYELSEEQAKFSAPDITYYGGKYFTIFTPGVSFAGVPLYLLGKYLGFPQLGAYSLNFLLAIINVFLIYLIGSRLSGSKVGGLIAGFIFLFATNALSYSATFTQHHGSTFLLLALVILTITRTAWWKNILAGLIFGWALLFDIPNAVIFSPVLFILFLKHFSLKKGVALDHLEGVASDQAKYRFSLNFSILLFILGIAGPLWLFAGYNKALFNSPTKLGQTVGRVDYLKEGQQDTDKEFGELLGLPYRSRRQLDGLYILLFGNERGWFYFSPVLALGVVGLVVGYLKKDSQAAVSLIAWAVGMIILSYSMFGDPWGGWSFGSRYLIPASALGSVGIAFYITRFRRNVVMMILLLILSIYSFYISTLGALTTNNVPPKVEAINFADPTPYTYEYNFRILEKNTTGSLIYNLFFKDKFTVKSFHFGYTGLLTLVLVFLWIASIMPSSRRGQGK